MEKWTKSIENVFFDRINFSKNKLLALIRKDKNQKKDEEKNFYCIMRFPFK